MKNTPHRLIELARFRKFGRLLLTRDTGDGQILADLAFQTHLGARVIRADGTTKDYDLGSGLVTSQAVLAFGNWLANVSPVAAGTLNKHDSSTGTTAAAVGDTALGVAPAATVGARAAGSVATAVSGANQTFTTVGTQSYTGSLAITEWGLFNLARTAGAAPPGSDVMLDHKVFAAINVASGDSIQWTYVLTLNSGG